MIHTSYFAVAHRKASPERLVSIARKAPNGFAGAHYPQLYPPSWLLQWYKSGKVNDEEYEVLYRSEVLSKLNPETVAKQLDGKVLVCWEKSGSFCHRNLVMNWLPPNYQGGEL